MQRLDSPEFIIHRLEELGEHDNLAVVIDLSLRLSRTERKGVDKGFENCS